MKMVYKADNITEAHIVSGLLNANDINANVSGYYLQGAAGEIGAFDYVSVMVDDENVDSALVLIEAYEKGELSNES